MEPQLIKIINQRRVDQEKLIRLSQLVESWYFGDNDDDSVSLNSGSVELPPVEGPTDVDEFAGKYEFD